MQPGKSSLLGFSIVSALAVLLLQSCQHAPALPPAPVAGNSFLDLLAGWRLRVVAPVLNDPSQPYSLTLNADSPLAFTVTKAPNLKGFETQFYKLIGTKTRVNIAFDRATLTRNGQAQAEAKPLKNYFPVPPGKFHLRLIYLTRSTEAPHDMALVFTRHAAELSSMTARIAETPTECDSQPRHCLWIPAGVAVIAERNESPGAQVWTPVQ